MENLIVTDNKEGFPDVFLNTPTNLFLLNEQVPLLLPAIQKQLFESATVHLSQSAGAKVITKNSRVWLST